MDGFTILCDIGDAINFIIAGKSQLAKLTDLDNAMNINRIYRIQFHKPPKREILDCVLQTIQKRPEIDLRFYGGYSEDLIDWDKLSNIQKLQIDLWNVSGLEKISGLTGLKTLGIFKNVSSKVSLRILEPLLQLETLYTSISKDIETVGKLEKLKEIRLNEIKSNNLEFLSPLQNLQKLWISLGSIKNFDALKNLNRLQKLHLVQVRGFDDLAVDVLSSCRSIEALKIDFQKHLSQLNFIKGMSGLKYLSFEGVQHLESYDPILENHSLETLGGYKCRPKDRSLIGLKQLTNIGLGDSYTKSEIDDFLRVSRAKNVVIRGTTFRGAGKIINPFFPF